MNCDLSILTVSPQIERCSPEVSQIGPWYKTWICEVEQMDWMYWILLGDVELLQPSAWIDFRPQQAFIPSHCDVIAEVQRFELFCFEKTLNRW